MLKRRNQVIFSELNETFSGLLSLLNGLSFKLMFTFLTIFSLLDAATTTVGLKSGCVELNRVGTNGRY